MYIDEYTYCCNYWMLVVGHLRERVIVIFLGTDNSTVCQVETK